MNKHPSSYCYGRANFMKPHFQKQVGPCLVFFYLLAKKQTNKQKYKMMQTAISFRTSLVMGASLEDTLPPFSNHVNIGGRV